MDSLLGALGLLFFMFLVLAAAVEVILEVFRGTLEHFGITWAKGKVSLHDALKLAGEFAPNDADLNTKLQAVKTVADQIKKGAADKIAALDTLKQKLSAASPDLNVIAGDLNEIAASVKADLESSERNRVFVLRLLAAIVGCILIWQSNFYVFQILAKSPNAENWLSALQGLQAQWINILVGGLAAAAGSSYWHDQLDKIRSLKNAAQQVKVLGS